jgi:stage V sporulation protein S
MATPQPAVPTERTPSAAAPAPVRAPASLHAPIDTLRVSATSRPAAVAGAVAGMIRERGHAEVQAIGAGAINQAVKAIAIARGYLVPSGVDIACIPGFIDVTVNAQERTAIRFAVFVYREAEAPTTDATGVPDASPGPAAP